MKWVVLLAGLILCPLISAYLRGSPRKLAWAAFAFGFLPFVLTSWRLYFAPVSWAGWPGWPKGMELTAFDFLALAVIMGSRRRLGFDGIVPWLLYILAVLVSVAFAAQKIAAIFYVWQLLRMVLVFLAAQQLATAPKASERLLQGVVAGVIYQAFFALSQFVHGVAQPGGAFGAQNLLGLMTNFALVPCAALLLVRGKTALALAGVLFGVVLDYLTASRATLGLAAMGLGAMMVFSCWKGMTGRKAAVLISSLLFAAAVGPLAVNSMVQRRGADEIASSNEEREAFKRAAWMIIADYPFGTGANQYVIVANTGGYSQRAGVAWNATSRATSVHNSYLLVWAETGLLGIITMLLLLGMPVWQGIRTAFRARNDPRSELLLGFSVALLVFAVHLMFEWAFILYVAQYNFAVYAGFVVALSRELRMSAHKRKSGRSVARDLTEQPTLIPKPTG